VEDITGPLPGGSATVETRPIRTGGWAGNRLTAGFPCEEARFKDEILEDFLAIRLREAYEDDEL
jgi:hypothetical protein